MSLSDKYLYLLISILILFLLILNLYQIKINILEKFTNLNNNRKNNEIIKKLCQTYHSKSKIPKKVFQNIKKFLPDFEHIVFDDNDCLKFMKNFDNKYSKIELNNKSTVESFKIQKINAHKADLFRYCYLYENGGLYADIKTIFIKPIEDLKLKKNIFYSVIDLSGTAIYQGVIYSPPKNKIFLDNIKFILDNPNPPYRTYINYLYESLKKHSINNNLTPGFNKMKDIPNIYLFQEQNFNKEECENKLDRYNFCCYITDKKNKIIRTRYSDFPW